MKLSVHKTLLVMLLCSAHYAGRATAWTTVASGNINNLTSWTNGSSSPTSFTTPGDTWAITHAMNLPTSASWVVGSPTGTPATVTFASGGSVTDTASGGAPTITIYGNVVGNGGTYSVTGNSCSPVISVYGNTILNAGSLMVSGSSAHFTVNFHGTNTMNGGSIGVTGASGVNAVNFYGNTSLTGTFAVVSTGSGTTGAVHFALPSSSGMMLIDNSCTGTWPGTDVYIDTGSTAKLDGNFTTNTGTIANGLTVNGRLIIPAGDTVTGSNDFSVNTGATLIVAHANGIDGAIASTGINTFSAFASYGYNGTAHQMTGSLLPAALFTPDTLIISNPSGVTLSQNTSTTGILAFDAGKLQTSINTMTTPGNAGAVTGAGAGSYVIGTLIKTIAGDTLVNYEVGDTDYAPITVKFDAAGVSGKVGATVNYGLHPSAGSSSLSTTMMVNHYWTLSNYSAAGPAMAKVKATYDLADILGGSNSVFSTQEYDGSFWLPAALPSTNTVLPYTTMTDTGIALGAIQGDYIFGRRNGTLQTSEIASSTQLSVNPNPNNGTFTFLLTSPANDAAQVNVTDVLGREVKTLSATTNEMTSVSLPATGVYFLSAIGANGRVVSKVIVQ